ncbi:MAG: tetratricopeptide repeat protein [Acidobacteria bacterium]|nr:MAG: tetratricopeptide repeat protein [Acidobacteriota bacterium]
MAFDKAKALQEAHKYVAQGKTGKAIKQYEWLVENDPGDLILLNVIGDLYAGENNVPEALKYFYRLADAYTRDGYRVKAIAIYKKIAKLDRGSADPLLRLAELNSAQGLAREAREYYKGALDFFERRGQQEPALEILRKLSRLDPKDHGLRLNLAQAAERAGKSREAADAYLGAAVLAREIGDPAACRSALEKASELAPENAEVHLLRARQALADQKPEEIGEILGTVPALQGSPEAKRLLLESCLATNNLDAARGFLLEVLELNPSNFAPTADFISRCIEKGEYESALQVLKDAAPVLIARGETGPFIETLRRLWKTSPESIDVLEFSYQVAEKTADEATIPEVLLLLGSAYVQSDQFEKAEQAYARLAAREPENETCKDLLRNVLEKQGKVFVPLSQTPLMSADIGLESTALPSQFVGATGLSSSDKQAADELARVPEEHGEANNGTRFREEVLEPGQPAAGFELPLRTLEFNLSKTDDGGASVQESELPPPKEISLDFQSTQEDKSYTGGSGITRERSSAEKLPQLRSAEQAQASKLPPFNYEESREEIEFYLRHGFYNEAQKALDELEREYPEEGRVSELRQRVDHAAQESSLREGTRGGPARSVQSGQETGPDLPTSFFDSALAAGPAQGNRTPAVSGTGSGRIDLIQDLAGQLNSKFEELYDPAMPSGSSAAQRGQNSGPDSAPDASEELSSLLDELEDENESVDQSADDEQTHYNLGVAFREMGLLDEAIGEFQKVVNVTCPKHPGHHFLQGCTLLASCFMDKEMPAIAAKWYLRALDAPGLDYEGTLALYYDLGTAFERAGDTAAALEKFTEVYSQNIDYRDVADKIRILRQTSR